MDNSLITGTEASDSDDEPTRTQTHLQNISLSEHSEIGDESDGDDDIVDKATQEASELELLTRKYEDIVKIYIENFSVTENAEQTAFDTSDRALQSAGNKSATYQIMGMNVRGLNSNKTQLENLFQDKRVDNTILFLTEIFEPASNIEIEGWTSYYLTRPKMKKQRRGGVAITVPKCYTSKKIDTLTKMQEGGALECLAVEITELNLICLCIYRPIGQDYLKNKNRCVEDFCSELQDIIELCTRKYPAYGKVVMGDFNINLLDTNSEHAQNLVTDMAGFGLSNQVHAPTRICDTTATLIDHCWTDVHFNKTKVLIDGVADHCGIYCEIQNPDALEEEEPERLVRVLNGAAFKRIKKELRQADWSFIHEDCYNIEQKWRMYEEKITVTIRACAPLKKQQKKKKEENWYTRRLRNLKQKVNLWQIRCQREPMHMCQNAKTTKQNFNYHRNKYKKAIKQAKNEHWVTLFQNAKDSKQTWALMNKAMQREQEQTGIKEMQGDDGMVTTDKKEISNIVNEFFANVGEETAKKIPYTQKEPLSYLEGVRSDKFAEKFLMVDQEQVEKTIKSLKPKHNDMDNSISMKIIRECKDVLSHTLTLLLNESIEKNVFPEVLKIAEVVPLYKNKGSRKEATNYRPISLLDPFGKIFEKIIEFQLRAFMEYAEQLTKSQHGYRENHSCDSMIISFLQEVSDSLRNDDVAVIILLDCSKAFDSISRPLLLKKLEKYGIREGALELIRSYLVDRTQRVKVGTTYSDFLPCHTGVPQGSILGPVLYIIYTNDVDVAIDSWSSLYADDNNSMHRAKTLDEAMLKAQSSLSRTEEWFRSNKVCVNGAKSKYIVVSRREQGDSAVQLQIEGKNLQRVRSSDKNNSSTAFVGLHLDEKFDFAPHINAMCQRALKSLATLAMVKKRLPKGARLQIFHSLIQSHLCLNIIASGRANKDLINRLQVIQNKALRIVEDLPSRASCTEARQKHKILTIKSQYEYTNCLWAARYLMKSAPKTVMDILEECRNFERNTQFVIDNITNERARKLSCKNSISKSWNGLEQEVRRDLVRSLREGSALPRQERLPYAKRILKKVFLQRDREEEEQRKKKTR